RRVRRADPGRFGERPQPHRRHRAAAGAGRRAAWPRPARQPLIPPSERAPARSDPEAPMHPRKPRLPFANAWFFPAAALYAAVLLPISVLGLLGLLPALP